MTNGRRTRRRWGSKGNQLARHPHEDDVDDRGRVSGPFRQRELLDSNMRITYSTKKAYAGYLTKWIVPRWGQNVLQHIKAREVELSLASVQRARTTRAKIRNVMSVLFNHARRYDLFDANPIQWVRQAPNAVVLPM